MTEEPDDDCTHPSCVRVRQRLAEVLARQQMAAHLLSDGGSHVSAPGTSER